MNSSRTLTLSQLVGANSLGKLSPDVTIHAACQRFETPRALQHHPPNEPNCLLLLEVLRSLTKTPLNKYLRTNQKTIPPEPTISIKI